MSGIKDTTRRMTRSQRDKMVSDVRRAQADAQRARLRENAAEDARRKAEERSSQLTSQLNQANQTVSRIQKETNQQMTAIRSQVDGVRREQNQRLEQMSRENTSRLNQQAREFQSRLRQQSDNFNSHLESQRNELTAMLDDVKTDLKEQGQKLSRRIEQNRRELEQSIDQVSDRIDQVSDRIGKIEQTQQNHKEIAQFWISEAKATFGEIKENRHDLFAPGRLAELQSALQASQNDIKNQAYQTAIGTARTVFRDAMGLKEDVINAEMEWNEWYNLLSQLYAETKSNLIGLDSMQFEYQAYNEDGEEETVTVDADIDYWTDGKLGLLKEQFSNMEQSFNNAENCTSSELQGMMDELVEIQEIMNHLEADSRVSIQLSQERRDIACNIVEALSEGFAFDINSSLGTYIQNEYRDSYEGTIKNPVTHDQVSFRISPKENEEGLLTNKMELHYFSDTNQAILDEQMLGAVTQAITGNGISLSEMHCREGYENRCSDQKELLEI